MKENLPAKIFVVAFLLAAICLLPSVIERDRKRQIELAKTDSLFRESEKQLNKLRLDMQRLMIRMDSTNKQAKRLLQDMKATNQKLSK